MVKTLPGTIVATLVLITFVVTGILHVGKKVLVAMVAVLVDVSVILDSHGATMATVSPLKKCALQPVVKMNNGTLAAAVVLRDTAVTPMTKVTVRTKTVLKPVNPDANVCLDTLVITPPDFVSPRTTAQTVHGAPTVNTLAIACTGAMNPNAVVAGVTLTMVPVTKDVLVTKGSFVIK